MARKLVIKTKWFPYHVTNRSNHREWFYIPIFRLWNVFEETLLESAGRYKTEIHSFVLMSNHFHLLLSTPQSNISEFMRYFTTESCRLIQRSSGRTNHVFGGRYKWSILSGPFDLAYTYKYIYRNPVRAGLTQYVEDYKYSSLYHLVRQKPSVIPIVEGYDRGWGILPKPLGERIRWLNQSTQKKNEVILSLALRRFQFQFTSQQNLQSSLLDLKREYGIDTESR